MRQRVLFVLGCTFLMLVLGTSLLALPVQAAPRVPSSATFYVNQSAVGASDANDCTVSTTPCLTIGGAYDEMVMTTTVSNTISIAVGTYTENLVITKSVSLQGAGASTTIVDGGNVDRVVQLGPALRVTINNLTLQHGSANLGGGISISPTTRLTLRNSVIANNAATTGGGGAYVSSGASLLATRSSFNNKSPSGSGAGVWNDVGASTSISESAVISNTAQNGGGIANASFITLTNSTVGGNTASQKGGGIFNSASVSLNNVTISGNTGTTGGNGLSSTGTVVMQNTILAANPTNGSPDCSGTLADTPASGYNILGNATGCTGLSALNHDQIGVNPVPIGPLALNHGFSLNYMPNAGPNAVVDHGNPNGCTDASGNLLTVDQRAGPRPQGTTVPAICDVGADELGPGPLLSSINPSSAPAGSGNTTLTVNGGNFLPTSGSVASTVLWNGTALATTFISATQLTAVIPAADLVVPGTANVSVQVTGTEGGTTGPLQFTIFAGTGPFLSGINPTTMAAGSAAFTLAVTGGNFESGTGGSVVMWNSTALTTSFVDTSHLNATVPASFLTSPGSVNVSVTQGGTNPGTTGSLVFTITPKGQGIELFLPVILKSATP